MRRKLPEKQNRTIERPIHGLVARGIQECVGNVWESGALLRDKRSAEQRISNTVADAEGWFGTELFQNELFNWIVEKTPAHADGGLVRATGELGKCAILPAGAPVKANPRRKSLVVSTDEPAGNALVSRNNKPCGSSSGIRASRRRVGGRLEE